MSIKYLSNVFAGLLSMLIATPIQAQTKVFDKIVAKDGTGDNTTIGTAINMLGATKRTIFVKNGIYKEKILITTSNIRLIGESKDGVIITYDDYAGKSGTSSSTAESYTVRIEGNGFYAENITFQNTATQAQAVAIYTKADTIAFKNCRFQGYQDTHYADNGRQYFIDCETSGDVDFIFGSAAAMYENSTIISRNRKGGYISAPSTAAITSPKTGGGTIYHGIVFKNCEIQAESSLADNSCYLGRPWGTYASSVFYNCKIGTHIKPEGWSVWSSDPTNEGYNNHSSAFFAEYNSTNISGNPLDISQRVTWSRQLGASDTSLYTISNYFMGWDPTLKTTSLLPPSNIRITNDSIKWDAVDGARGYIILRNDSAKGFTTATGYNVSDYLSQTHAIKTVSRYGALSKVSSDIHNALPSNEPATVNIYVANDILFAPANKKIEIYSMSGTIVNLSYAKQNISLDKLTRGFYIVKVYSDKTGKIITQKILK